MNSRYTEEQAEHIRNHEDEAQYFGRIALASFTVAGAAAFWLIKTANLLALILTGLAGLIGCHSLVQCVTALNSRDKARGYGSTFLKWLAFPGLMAVALLSYLYFSRT